jgi:hypothetical protein
MNVVFYYSGIDHTRMFFEKEVISVVPSDCRIVCNTLEELSSTLRRSAAGQSICVVVTCEKKDLLDLFSIQALLLNSKLILILPDNAADTIEIGHKFYPRFLDSINHGFSNLTAVLDKMANIVPNRHQSTITDA